MTKIVRTPSKATGGITPAEKTLLDTHTAKWIKNAMSTEPVNPVRLTQAIKELYAVSGLKEPRVVIVSSPLVMAFAGGFAAAIWWARKNNQHAATFAATFAATKDATEDATDAATRSATRSATEDVTYAATYAATDISRAFGISPSFLLSFAKNWWKMYQGGNMWSYYDCYMSAFRDVLGLRLPAHEKYKAWETCAIEGGFRFIHEEFCIVSDRPEILTVDAQNRPHNATGPSHRWRDGWSLYHYHGVKVTPDIIENPASITIARIKAETNAEVRRVMIELYGYERYCVDAKLTLVDSCSADHPIQGLRTAKLWRDDNTDEPLALLDVLNSTPEPDGSTRRYVIAVDPNAYGGRAAKECLAASASTWRRRSDNSLFYKTPEEYAPVAES